MDITRSETSVLIEIIKEQNLIISSLKKTIEELNVDSKILREQIDCLMKNYLEQRVKMHQ